MDYNGIQANPASKRLELGKQGKSGGERMKEIRKENEKRKKKRRENREKEDFRKLEIKS